MPITFACNSCGKKLRVRDEVGGKRVKCPGCGTVIAVPAASTSGGAQQAATPSAAPGGPSPRPPSRPAPTAEKWYLKTEDEQTYGPVPKAELDEWMQEGRITAQSQVLREGADQWQWATDVYPQLEQRGAGAAGAGASPNPFDFTDRDSSSPYAAPRTQFTTYQRQRPESGAVTAVAIVNFVFGGLIILCGMFVMVAGGAVANMIAGMGDEGRAAGGAFAAIFVGIGVFFAIVGVGMEITGYGILKRQQWGRILGLVLGAIAGLFALLGLVGLVASGEPGNIVGVLLYGGYCALSYVVLLNSQFAAEFR